MRLDEDQLRLIMAAQIASGMFAKSNGSYNNPSNDTHREYLAECALDVAKQIIDCARGRTK